MKKVYTAVGKPYAVTTSAACTITTPEGVLIASCEPGYQVIFVAPCDVVCVSSNEAHVTETFSSAASAVSGGGLKKKVEDYMDGKAAEIAAFAAEAAASAEEAREAAQRAAADAREAVEASVEKLSSHVGNDALHVQPGEREWWDSPFPPGVILPSAGIAMEGFLLCDGSAVSREAYASLFAAIGTTYGEGDGEGSFNLPDLRGRTLWGAHEASPLGSVLEAGLPEITGSVTCYGYSSGYPSGAFSTTYTNTNCLAAGAASGSNLLGSHFKASASNSIYGASTTVQPPAVAINYFIKY